MTVINMYIRYALSFCAIVFLFYAIASSLCRSVFSTHVAGDIVFLTSQQNQISIKIYKIYDRWLLAKVTTYNIG